jgi:Trk-type K+ transport system membrane component
MGGVFVSPLFKKIGFVTQRDHIEYLYAEQKDVKISILEEERCVLRSFITLTFLLLLILLTESTNFFTHYTWCITHTTVFTCI